MQQSYFRQTNESLQFVSKLALILGKIGFFPFAYGFVSQMHANFLLILKKNNFQLLTNCIVYSTDT